MKVMLRKTEAGYTIYVAKKDLEEPVVESQLPGLWGGWIRLANGWTLELPDMPPDTRWPVTIEAKKLT